MDEKELSETIEVLRRELEALIGRKKNYDDSEVISKSMELDRALNALMQFQKKRREKK